MLLAALNLDTEVAGQAAAKVTPLIERVAASIPRSRHRATG